MADFTGKVALVTGGTGALGAAVAEAFLAAGARVSVTYRRPSEWEALRQRCRAYGDRLSGYATDLLQADQVGATVQAVLNREGRIDCLCNIAGGYGDGRVGEIKPEKWEFMLHLNLKTAYLALHHVLPIMQRQGYGKVVNVSASTARRGTAGDSAYAAAKAGVERLTESAQAEAGQGININCISPAMLDTEQNRRDMPDAAFSEWSKTEDVARVVLFLCSDDAKVVRGCTVDV